MVLVYLLAITRLYIASFSFALSLFGWMLVGWIYSVGSVFSPLADPESRVRISEQSLYTTHHNYRS